MSPMIEDLVAGVRAETRDRIEPRFRVRDGEPSKVRALGSLAHQPPAALALENHVVNASRAEIEANRG